MPLSIFIFYIYISVSVVMRLHVSRSNLSQAEIFPVRRINPMFALEMTHCPAGTDGFPRNWHVKVAEPACMYRPDFIGMAIHCVYLCLCAEGGPLGDKHSITADTELPSALTHTKNYDYITVWLPVPFPSTPLATSPTVSPYSAKPCVLSTAKIITTIVCCTHTRTPMQSVPRACQLPHLSPALTITFFLPLVPLISFVIVSVATFTIWYERNNFYGWKKLVQLSSFFTG